MKTFAILMLANLIILTSSNCLKSMDDIRIFRPDLTVSTYNNIDIGDIISGTHKSVFLTEQIIKFEIKGSAERSIRIKIIKEAGNKYIHVDAEWKFGPNSGFENHFSGDEIVKLDDETFFVTMKILSVEVESNTPSGRYSVYPEIIVEYID